MRVENHTAAGRQGSGAHLLDAGSHHENNLGAATAQQFPRHVGHQGGAAKRQQCLGF